MTSPTATARAADGTPLAPFATSNVPLGNGAFLPDGRLVVSHHPMWEAAERVSVLATDGTLTPFPDAAWNTPRPEEDPEADTWLDAVLGLRADDRGRLWLLDMGTRSGVPPKFVVWDAATGGVTRVLRLPSEALTPNAEPNDFALDLGRGYAYLADEGAGRDGDGSTAALVVLDLATGRARRRLEGRPGIAASREPLVVDGEVLTHEVPGSGGRRAPHRAGVDGIALDAAGDWLYLSALNGRALLRLRVDDLLDPALSDDALAACVERYADKPNAGGIWVAPNGDVYLTEIEASAVGRVVAAERREDRRYERVLTGPGLFWPDGLMPGPDGALYVVSSQLPRCPKLSGAGDQARRPFGVFRVEPAAGAAGR